MSLRYKAVYTVKPHPSNPRRHTIPIEVARLILSDPEALPTSLDQRQCLVKLIVIEHDKITARFPSTIVYPSSGNEINCSADKFASYPAKLSEDARIVVEIVVID